MIDRDQGLGSEDEMRVWLGLGLLRQLGSAPIFPFSSFFQYSDHIEIEKIRYSRCQIRWELKEMKGNYHKD